MRFFAAISLCVIATASFAAAQDSSTIAVKQGQTQVQFKLKSNPTTGYRWYLKKCSSGIKPVSAKYEAYNGKLVGAPGSVVWTFKLSNTTLNVPRVMRCDLVYMRAWDPSSATKKTLWFITGS